MIRLDRELARGVSLEVDRDELPPPKEDEYYVFQLVGLDVEREDGTRLGRVTNVEAGVANDVLELDSGPAAAPGRGLRAGGRSRGGDESLSLAGFDEAV